MDHISSCLKYLIKNYYNHYDKMKRNDSLLSKLYYQALPKAKEGGNYFNKYKVPVNNTPEKRIDPILSFFNGGFLMPAREGGNINFPSEMGYRAPRMNNGGGLIVDSRGQWAHPGKNTRVISPNITMDGVPYPVLAKANNGQQRMMYPGQQYSFPGADYVDEYPMMKKGGQKCPKGYINIDGKCIKLDSQEYIDMLDKGQVGTMEGDTFWGNKSTLQPVTIHGSKDKGTNEFYKKLAQVHGPEAYEALLELGQKYGSPYVSINDKPGFFDPEYPEGSPNAGKYRPTFNPFTGNMTLGDSPGNLDDAYIAELAHRKQWLDKGPTDFQLRGIKLFPRIIKNFLDPNKKGYEEEYDIPGSIEYEAHKEIEPKLQKEYDDLYWKKMDESHYYKYPGTNSYWKPTKTYKNGGGLLSRTVTCSNCGWSWKAVDGGIDPMTCHKCGGMVKMQDGGLTTQTTIPPATQDSVRHQANKILQYEQLRGGPGGTPLPQYSNSKYMDMLMGKIYPEVKKIMPNASAMEAGEAMDFVFNAGFDQGTNKITKDPRAFALQEYYRQNDPSKLDADGKWAGRKNAPYSFDQEYSNTIGKLPENQRRILMNKGRDWYYQNTAPKGSTWDLKTQGAHPDYKNTWYGRIWNTNDYKPFDPNNPNFIFKKEMGGDISIPDLQEDNWLKAYGPGGKTTDGCPPNFYKNAQGKCVPEYDASAMLKKLRAPVQDNTRPLSFYDPIAIGEIKTNKENKEKAETAALLIRAGMDEKKAKQTVNLKKLDRYSQKKLDEQKQKEYRTRMSQGYDPNKPIEDQYNLADINGLDQRLYRGANMLMGEDLGNPVLNVTRDIMFGPGKSFVNLSNPNENYIKPGFVQGASNLVMDLFNVAPTMVGGATRSAVNLSKNAINVSKNAIPGIVKGIDKKIYPTRAYRASVPGGNPAIYSNAVGEEAALANKVFNKGDFATKDLKETFQYLKGLEGSSPTSQYTKTGLTTGQGMNLTEFKIPFFKKNVSFDKDVTALKKLQGMDINVNEYIVPGKTRLDKLLYPRRTTFIEAVPEHLKNIETILPSGHVTNMYNKGTIPMSASSSMNASEPYKYIEDQLNAVTGHEMPMTFTFDQSKGFRQTTPITNWTQPQFAPNSGFGKFTRFSKPTSISSVAENVSTGRPKLSIAEGNLMKNELELKNQISRSEINNIAKRENDWVNSDEYLKRRMTASGETAEQVKADVAKYNERFKRTDFLMTPIEGNLAAYYQHEYIPNFSGKNIFEKKIKNPKIVVGNDVPIDEGLSSIDHEIKHAFSQTSNANPNYKGYPTIKLGNWFQRNMASIGKKADHIQYLNRPEEQQVRNLKLLDHIEKSEGVKRGEQISSKNLANFIEKNFQLDKGTEYRRINDDVVDYINEIVTKYGKDKAYPVRKRLLDVLNKSYAIPVPIALGAAALQQKKEGDATSTLGYEDGGALPKFQGAGETDPWVTKAANAKVFCAANPRSNLNQSYSEYCNLKKGLDEDEYKALKNELSSGSMKDLLNVEEYYVLKNLADNQNRKMGREDNAYSKYFDQSTGLPISNLTNELKEEGNLRATNRMYPGRKNLLVNDVYQGILKDYNITTPQTPAQIKDLLEKAYNIGYSIPKQKDGGWLEKYQGGGEEPLTKSSADWYKQWYEQRKTLPQFSRVAGERFNLLSTLPKVQLTPLEELQKFGAVGEYIKNRGDDASQDIISLADPATVPAYAEKIGKSIDVNVGTDPSVVGHEMSHWFDARAKQSMFKPRNSKSEPYEKYPFIKPSSFKKSGLDSKTYNWISGDDNPEVAAGVKTELNSVLNELREKEGLRGDQSTTPEQLQKIIDKYMNLSEDDLRKSSPKGNQNQRIRTLIKYMGEDPEKLSELNNRIVAIQKEDVPIAKHGGWVNKYKGGDVSIYGRRNYSADTPTFFATGGATEDDCPPGWIKGPNGDCVQDFEARRKLAKKSVEIAKQHIADDNYFDVPENLKKAAEAQNEGAYGCIGGVCSIYTEAGVMSKPNWSNTDFALHAKEYGFPNQGYGLDQLRYLEPGDALQYYDRGSKNWDKAYPHHSQMFLGVNPDSGEYEFFDNFNKSMRSYPKKTLEKLFKSDNEKNRKEYGRIYKVNPYVAGPVVTNPEAIKALEERKKTIEFEKEFGEEYEYGIRKDSPYYKDQPIGMKKFIEWANKKENINNLVEKLGVGKGVINDELLNTFGELGQENKWQNRTFAGEVLGLEGVYEKVFKPKNKSIGPGQIKFNTISNDLKEKFEINTPKDLYNWDKIIPLMTAMNIKNRKWMENKGTDLSKYLIGKEGVGADELKYGVGRWTPYMYRGSIDTPEDIVMRNAKKDYGLSETYSDPTISLPENLNQSLESYLNSYKSSPYYKKDLRKNSKLFQEGSYADKVFRNIDENLERSITDQTQPQIGQPRVMQPIIIKGTQKKKQAHGGSINNNWLNKYKS